MFTPHEIALLVALPFLLTFLISLFSRWPRKRRTTGRSRMRSWPPSLALSLAVLASGLSAFRLHTPPREAFDWLLLLPLLALFAGNALWPRMARLFLALPAGLLTAWLLASPGAAITERFVVALAPMILFAALAPLARRPGNWCWPLIFLVLAGCTVAVEAASTGIDFGKYTIALAAAAAGLLAAAAIIWRSTLGRDALSAFLLLWIALLAYGHFWADVPPWRTTLLAASPLAALLSLLPIFKSPTLRGWTALLAVTAVALLPAIPAALDVLKLIRSQTEVGGY